MKAFILSTAKPYFKYDPAKKRKTPLHSLLPLKSLSRVFMLRSVFPFPGPELLSLFCYRFDNLGAGFSLQGIGKAIEPEA
jgi:hypothetical protein